MLQKAAACAQGAGYIRTFGLSVAAAQSGTMEQEFDGWVRNRFQVESSDIPDIASHIDLDLFEPDWTLPSGVDDLFSWLTGNEDLQVDLTANHDPQLTYVPAVAAAGAAQAHTQHNELPAQQLQHLLQEAVQQQQPVGVPLAVQAPAQQQQQDLWMFPAGSSYQGSAQACVTEVGYPANAAVLQHGQQQQQPGSDAFFSASDDCPAEAAAAAGHASTAPLQEAGHGSLQQKSSGSSLQQDGAGSLQQKGSKGRAPKTSRRVTDAQRAAHKRFRVRRKEQVWLGLGA